MVHGHDDKTRLVVPGDDHGTMAAASERSPALRVRALAGNAFMEHDPDMTDYLEYTGNPYFLPEIGMMMPRRIGNGQPINP